MDEEGFSQELSRGTGTANSQAAGVAARDVEIHPSF